MAAILRQDGTREVTPPPVYESVAYDPGMARNTPQMQTANLPGVYDVALQQAGDKPTYNGSFEGQLNDIYGKIANREKFSYDVNADPLYQSYKDNYINQGKLAMKDTMGQAAALTGGYGTTYGQQVGQQAYDAYLQNLSAVIPQLYGMAYDQYRDEGDQLNNLYALAGKQRDLEYSRYRDELGDWENQLQRGIENERYQREWDRQAEQEAYNRQQTADEIARQLERQDYDRRMQQEAIERQIEQTNWERQKYAEEVEREKEQEQYNRGINAQQWAYKVAQEALNRAERQEETAYNRGKYEDETAYNRAWNENERDYNRKQTEYSNEKAEEETAYKKQQQAYSNLYNVILRAGYRPNAQELLEAGMTEAEADALYNEWQRQINQQNLSTYPSGSTGGSGGRSGGGNAYYQGLDDPWAENGSDYDIWKEAVEMAQADGADAWNINSEIQRAQNLSPEEKRNLIVSGIENVDWDSYDRNGRLQYVNNNDQDTVAMGQVAPNNTAYENVMNNLSTTDELIEKIRNKKKKPTFRTDRLE